jgi:hypothetical protein
LYGVTDVGKQLAAKLSGQIKAGSKHYSFDKRRLRCI